ncbi:MAG: DUF2085 domain-containing protein [Anaerolineae bacterium]|nr:DUF2085 domain-containing protein [Anaerolineae bacterium]
MTSREQRKGSSVSGPVTGRTRDLVVFLDKTIFRLAKHWLALANIFWGLYVVLPVLAPVMMDAGWTVPARVVYTIYRPACHQRPERSYFVGGERFVYTPEELAARDVDLDPFVRDIGNQTVGWKMAFCQRDVAIYGSMFLAGLAYALVRRRLKGWKMPFRYFLLLLVPMGIDGVLQLFAFYESTWVMRTITGVIFGTGAVFFAYPYLEEGFVDVRRTVNAKLHLE